MSKTRNQQGFGAIVMILAWTLIVFIGLVGFMVYMNHNNKSKSGSATTASSAEQSTVATTKTDEQQAEDATYSDYGYIISPLKVQATISRSATNDICEANSTKICAKSGVIVKWTKDTPTMVAVKLSPITTDVGFYGTGYTVQSGDGIVITPFADVSKIANGTYTGSTKLQLQMADGSFIDGPTIECTIIVTN